MYEKRFGLHRKPFQSVLHDCDFFQSEAFAEMVPQLLHALRTDLGAAVLTGAPGSGKTTTLDYLQRLLVADSKAVLLRGGSARTSEELLLSLFRQIVKREDRTSHPESQSGVRRWDVVEQLQRGVEFWGPLHILVDDAHLLQPDAFSELRCLLEEEAQGQKLARLLICGSLALEELMARPALSDFAQKIRCHSFLQPLRTNESVRYLEHQLKQSGAELNRVFDAPAIELIVAAADGNPRCLNLLADETLMVCEEKNRDRATLADVNLALRRLQHLPVSWNATPQDTAEDTADDVPEPQSTANSDSVIEIVGMDELEPQTAEASDSSVIEFGAPPEQPVDTATNEAHDNTSSFVVEISAGEVSPDVNDAQPAENHSAADVQNRSPVSETGDLSPDFELQFDDAETQETDTADSAAGVPCESEPWASDMQSSDECQKSRSMDFKDNETVLAPTNILLPDLSEPELLSSLSEPTEVPALDETHETPEYPRADSETLTEGADTATDFEHHLVLATSISEEGIQLAEDAVPEEIHESEVQVAPDITELPVSSEPTGTASSTDETASSTPNSIAHSALWEPPGSWPAPLQQVVAHTAGTEICSAAVTEQDAIYQQADQDSESDARSAVIADEADSDSRTATDDLRTSATPQTPPEKTSGDHRQHAATSLLENVNSAPVFDRFTWLELGRPVDAGHKVRVYVPEDLIPASWPPDLTGTVPADVINIHTITHDIPNCADDDRQDSVTAEPSVPPEPPLPEDASLGDQAAEPDQSAASDECGDEKAEHVVVVVPGSDSEMSNTQADLPPSGNPDLTIDQIQEMLHTELFDLPQKTGTISEEVVVDPDTNERQIWVRHQSEDAAADRSDPSDESNRNHPTVTSNDELPQQQSPSGKVASSGAQSSASVQPEPTERLAVVLPGAVETNVDSYEPRLMRLATEQLQQEAEHEQAVIEPEANEQLPVEATPPARDSGDTGLEDNVTDTDSLPISSDNRLRFRNLFTRLRQLRSRSA